MCVPITVHEADSALRLAQRAKDLGADLVEFRLDEFFTGQAADESGDGGGGDTREVREIVRLISTSPLPCIATCRPVSEGGAYDGPEDARIALFERLGTAFGRLESGEQEHPPRYLDVEYATYARSANIRQKIHLAIEHPEQLRALQTSLILSTHDFAGRPRDLTRRLLAMRQTPAKVLKVAYLARSLRDNLELFDLLAQRDRPMIALAMGEFGLMSRILAPKFGGFLTFASIAPTETTAPGQPTIDDLLHLYRFRAIRPSTAVYGVVAYPVAHSLSPHIHNAAFEAMGIDAVYLPLPIPGGPADPGASSSGGTWYEPLKATLLDLVHYAPLHLAGLSVTIPHKENLVRLALEQGWDLDEVSRAIGAANTVKIERDAAGMPARIAVSNTDAPALVGAIRDTVGDLAGLDVAVYGAGGAGKAAAYGLARAGACVTVYNRDPSRAAALASSLAGLGLEVRAADAASFPASAHAIAINATPVGMNGGPNPDSSPFDPATLPVSACVAETVYAPVRTPLLRAAEKAGLRTIDGVSMFVRQAALQFTNWTGRPAPAALFERIVREAAG